jgi:hypothetical protein
MHIVGKILAFLVLPLLAFLVLPLAVAASIYASKLVVYRNSWMQKIETLQVENEKNAKDIDRLEEEVRRLQSDLANTVLGWGRYWNVPAGDVQVNPNQAVVQVNNFGTASGFAIPNAQPDQLPTAYVFRQDGVGGESRFLGAFQPAGGQLLETAVPLQLVRPPRPGETATWQGNADSIWRIRMQIPVYYKNFMADRDTEFNRLDERLAAKQGNRDLQQKLIDVAQLHLNFRMTELLGPDNAPAQVAEDDSFPEFKVGLVRAIENERQQRDRELAVLYDLRRQTKTATDRLEFLVNDNRKLMNDLIRATVLPTAQAANE